MNLASLASIAASLLTLALSFWLFVASNSAQTLNGELQVQAQAVQNEQSTVQSQQQLEQAQRAEVEKTNQLASQFAPAIIQDLRTLAIQNHNEKLRGFLTKYNISLEEKPAEDANKAKPAAAPSASPAARPATTPAP